MPPAPASAYSTVDHWQTPAGGTIECVQAGTLEQHYHGGTIANISAVYTHTRWAGCSSGLGYAGNESVQWYSDSPGVTQYFCFNSNGIVSWQIWDNYDNYESFVSPPCGTYWYATSSNHYMSLDAVNIYDYMVNIGTWWIPWCNC